MHIWLPRSRRGSKEGQASAPLRAVHRNQVTRLGFHLRSFPLGKGRLGVRGLYLLRVSRVVEAHKLSCELQTASRTTMMR